MDRQTKLRRLNDYRRRLPHVTAFALGIILQTCRDEGIPEGNVHRNAQREARNAELNEVTPYGPIASSMHVIGVDGVARSIPIANPFALLWKAVRDCGPLAEFFAKRLLDVPSTADQPWGLILYTDGVTPGNPMAPINKRKFEACYFSFLEFGTNALSREESWFTLMTEFATTVTDISGGLSQIFGAIVKTFFDPEGFNMATVGLSLPFAAGAVRFFCKLKVVIQDGGAHKFVWQARGDGATKLCLLCKNLFTRESGIAAADPTGRCKSNILKWAELVRATGAEIRTNARFIATQAGILDNTAFSELQQSLGITHYLHGLLLDTTLDSIFDPTEVYMHDWMHCLFVDGVFSLAIYLLFEVFFQAGLPNIYQVCSDYVSKWFWPGRLHGTYLKEIFTDSRRDKHRKAGHIKAQASDLLSLVSVLALFTRTVLITIEADGAVAACNAFLALVRVIELIVNFPRLAVPAATLLSAVEKCLELWSVAWGLDSMTPKLHWLLHIHKQKHMLNCFCLERKHRIAKRYASEFKNVVLGASKSLLMEVSAHHLGELKKPGAFCFDIGLIDGSPASRRATNLIAHAMGLEGDHDIHTSINSRFNSLAFCSKNDIVLVREANRFRAGRVQIHCSVDGDAFSMISMFTLRKHEPALGYAVWDVSDDGAETVPTHTIIDPVVYSKWADDVICTLLPMELR